MEKFDNVRREKPEMVERLVIAHYEGGCESLHFSGEPSTVKSKGVWKASVSLARKLGKEFVEWNRTTLEKKMEVLADPERYFVFADVRATETDIGELRLQDMMNGEPFITFKYNVLFTALSKEGATGVLFLDEINNAPEMQKTQFYKIINDRAIGDIPIALGVLVCSAGNEVEHARGVTEDAMPLILRRANYFIEPPQCSCGDVQGECAWHSWCLESGMHEWVNGYTAFQPQNVHKVAYDNPKPIGQPCSRTWEKLSNVLRGLGEKPDMDLVRSVARGFVGQGVGEEFWSYVQTSRRVNIDEVIRNPSVVKEFLGVKDASVLYAVMSGLVARYQVAETLVQKRKLLDVSTDVSLLVRPEFGVFLMRQVKAVNKEFFHKEMPQNAKFAGAWKEKYAKYFFGE